MGRLISLLSLINRSEYWPLQTHRWWWWVGEGVAGCGGLGTGEMLSQRWPTDWRRGGQGTSEVQLVLGHVHSEHKRASKKTREKDISRIPAMFRGHNLGWCLPLTLTLPPSLLASPHKEVSGTLGSKEEREMSELWSFWRGQGDHCTQCRLRRLKLTWAGRERAF